MIPAQTYATPSAVIQTMEKYSRILALRIHTSRSVKSVIRQTRFDGQHCRVQTQAGFVFLKQAALNRGVSEI